MGKGEKVKSSLGKIQYPPPTSYEQNYPITIYDVTPVEGKENVSGR